MRPGIGLTPTDLVFPFFRFAMGNALAFVMPKFEQQGTPAFVKKVGRRTLLIFAIGLLLNWFPFIRWDHGQLVFKGWTWVNAGGTLSGVRVMGVLGRIALCYGLAAFIVYFAKLRGAFVIGGCLLLIYWALCLLLGDPADPYSLSGWFGTAIDKAVFGAPHMYHGEGVAFDPEGLASTIPAIVSVVLGYFAGTYIRLKGKSYEMLSHLFVAGVLLLFAGYCWSGLFPVNKKIWTSSYVPRSRRLGLRLSGDPDLFHRVQECLREMEPVFRCIREKPVVHLRAQRSYTPTALADPDTRWGGQLYQPARLVLPTLLQAAVHGACRKRFFALCAMSRRLLLAAGLVDG